jgi:hypothetical protein
MQNMEEVPYEDSLGESFTFSHLLYPDIDCDQDEMLVFGTPQFAKDDPKIFEEHAMQPFDQQESIDTPSARNLVEPDIDTHSSTDPAVTAIWNYERSRSQSDDLSCTDSNDITPSLQHSDLQNMVVTADINTCPAFANILNRVLRERSICRLSSETLSSIITTYHSEIMNTMGVSEDSDQLCDYILTNVTQKWHELNNVFANIRNEIDKKVSNWRMSDNPSSEMMAQVQERAHYYMEQRISEADSVLRSFIIEKEKLLVAFARTQQFVAGPESNDQIITNCNSAGGKSKRGRGISKNSKCFKKGRSSRVLSVEATSILYEWFDTHTAHPYPSLAEKNDLAGKTGLDVKQVNNW